MEKFFNKIIKIGIYLLVFLLAGFWLPFSFEAFEFNKQYLLFFLVSITFFIWLAKMVLIDKEIRFKRTPLDIPVLAFLFVVVLSAIFSVDKNSSVFGFYGRFSDGLIGLLSLGLMYFLITNNVGVKEEKVSNSKLQVSSLIKAFLGSVFFVVSMSYLSIFGVWIKIQGLIGAKFQLPQVMLQRSFNPASGSLEGLGVFLAVIIVFLIGLILTQNHNSKLKNFSYWALLLVSLFLLLIIDFTATWIVILVSLTLFVIFALWKRIFRERVNKLLLPIFLIIIAIAGVSLNTSTIAFNVGLPQEQVLEQRESWQIGFRTVTDNFKSGFLGSGIGTFHYDFSKFKSVEFNQTQFWQIRFDRAGNYISELLATIGFLGILSYLFLIGFFLLLSYLFINSKLKKPQLKTQNENITTTNYQLSLIMVFLALLVAQFVYYQNTILAFTFWLILAISVVSWQKPILEKTVSFKDFPELSLVFSTLLIVLGLVISGLYFFTGKFYLADINYKNAVETASVQSLEKAVNLNPGQPHYKMILARTYLNKILAETQKPVDIRDQAVLSDNVNRAITYAKSGQIDGNIKGATELAPNRVAAWETLGIIYRDIMGLATGALEWGIKAFETGIALEPTNPVLHTELGKLYLELDQNEIAKEKFTKAKELKPDYVNALIQEALIYERENNLETAVRRMESLAISYPFHTEVLFQMGRLYFNNNQIDEAISRLEIVVNLIPNHSNAHYSLGVAYKEKGEKQKAIVEFEKVLELNPGNEEVQAKLKELRE